MALAPTCSRCGRRLDGMVLVTGEPAVCVRCYGIPAGPLPSLHRAEDGPLPDPPNLSPKDVPGLGWGLGLLWLGYWSIATAIDLRWLALLVSLNPPFA